MTPALHPVLNPTASSGGCSSRNLIGTGPTSSRSMRSTPRSAVRDRIDDPAVSTAAMDGLAHLRSQAALGPLREIMQAGRDRRAVHAAMALWRIDRDEAAFRKLCRVVEDRPWLRRNPARVDAAAMLRQIERPAALVPLIGALDDRDIAVRANAKLAMRERLGLHAEADALKRGEMTVEELRRAARTALARVEDESP